MPWILLCTLFIANLTSTSQAQEPRPTHQHTTFERIAFDIDGILGDTVNEGDVQAHVAMDPLNQPVMNCKIRKDRKEPKIETHTCEVQFDVLDEVLEFDESGENFTVVSSEKCQASCRLIYKYNTETDRLEKGDWNRFTSCFETLSEGCE